MNQKTAVYNATVSVLSENGIEFEDYSDISGVITDSMRTQIKEILCAGFKAGEIEFKDTPANREKLADDAKLMSYVGGLLNNWHRKDKRFNGGVVYQAKNPGSRAGSTDPVIKNLRALLKTDLSNEQTLRVQEELDARIEEIKASKQKVEVDFEALPEGLLEDLGIEIE